jgi:antitoxin FitA
MGTLCVVGSEAHELSPSQREAVRPCVAGTSVFGTARTASRIGRRQRGRALCLAGNFPEGEMQARSAGVGQLTVRKIDDEIIRRLKIRAAQHGRSAEAEHREILKQALLPESQMDVDEWLRRARELRERLGPIATDSTEIMRKMRDER